MFTLRHSGIAGKCLKSVLCLAFILSPLALTAQSCVLNPSQFAYVANYNGTLSGYLLNSTNGKLSSVAGSPFSTGIASLNFVAVDPTSRFVYVTYGGNNKNVEGFTINCVTGRLTPIPGSPFSGGVSPYGMAFDPSGRFAYFADFGGNTVSALKIDSSSGRLLPIATYPAGSFPDAVAVDPLGKFVYVTNQSSNNISGYTINAVTGALTPMTGSPFPTGTAPASLAVDPKERFVYVANEGSANVWGYLMDPTTGVLSLLQTSPFAASGGGLNSVAFDPTGAYVYAGGYGGVFSYQVEQSNTDFGGGTYPPMDLYGQLTLMQGSPVGGGSPNSISVDYTGTFLYAADKFSNDLSAYTVSSGVLKPSTKPQSTDSSEPFSLALVRPQTLPSFTASQVAVPTGFGSPTTTTPVAINDNGVVLGNATWLESEFFASGYYATSTTATTVGLGDVGAALGINDKSQVVGTSFTEPASPFQTPEQAFLANPKTNLSINLDNVVGRQSAAIAINNAGQITGSLSTGICVPPFIVQPGCQGNTHAFVYNGAGLVDIGTLGGLNSGGTSINTQGIVVGLSATASGATHIFSYFRGHMYDLGTATGQSFGNAIVNDLGEILAISGGENGMGVSYLWRNGVFTKLPFVGASMNNRTEIVGAKAAVTAASRAYLYYRGATVDLNELVGPGLPLFTSANGISNNGKILVTGLNGQFYVLTPK